MNDELLEPQLPPNLDKDKDQKEVYLGGQHGHRISFDEGKMFK